MVIENLTSENIKDIGKDISKKTPYEVATALGFNRNKDKYALAKDVGINNYAGTAQQNIKIKEMLLKKIDELKKQEQNISYKETKHLLAIEKISIYENILNKIVYANGKISSKDQNMAIARNDGTFQRITTPNEAIPLVIDGKGVVIKYTNPTYQKEILLAIDDFKNNTFIFRDITEGDTTNLLYAAAENKDFIEAPEVTIVGINDNITTTTSSSSSEETLSGTPSTLELSSSPNLSGEISQSSIDSGTPSEQTKESGSLGVSIEDLQKSGKIPLVLTEDILQNYDLSPTNYPKYSIEKTYYPGTTIPYAEVYNYLYEQLKQHWEGKNISFTNLDGERVSGTINFVGGVFTINNKTDGSTISIQDVYELGPDYVIFRSGNQEGISELYKLTTGSLENNTLLATIEKITTNQQDKTSLPPEQLVENK